MTPVAPIVCDFDRIVPEIRTKLVVSSSKFIGAKGVEPVVCVAVWDTGSFTTVISPAVAKALSLVPMGKTPVHTANGSYLANVYSVDVMLPNGVLVQGVAASEAELKVCDALIGMDVISMPAYRLTHLHIWGRGVSPVAAQRQGLDSISNWSTLKIIKYPLARLSRFVI